jgi:hypothetical protein
VEVNEHGTSAARGKREVRPISARHASLTNLALAVVEDPVPGGRGVLFVRLVGDILDRAFTHVVLGPRHKLRHGNVRSDVRAGQS